ncbi:MAG: response regulator [Acidobacteriota bacterium]
MPRILAIDDDENVRDILRRMLSRRGYDVLLADNGKEGIRIFRQQAEQGDPIDLVVTDILMPEKEGLETIRELRQGFPQVKIIVMSGGGGLGEPGNILNAARKLGASYSFQKPIARDDFLATVRQLVGPGAERSSSGDSD